MHKTRQNGFTLIEVLISVFVLALGVIGAGGMQLVAMRTSQQSGLQTVAVQLATEMADNMRQNATAMNQADSNNPYLFTYNSATDGDPATATMCYTTACTSAQLAAADIYEWKTRLKAGLPGGRVVICRDETPWDTSASKLTWACASTIATTNSVPYVVKVGWQGKDVDNDKKLLKNQPPSVAITVQPYIK
ncbi:MAG: type IV pilus modification protein PilV [Burkholderiaceae bacterium]